MLEREETVVRWLTGLLDRVKSDQFDPSTLIQESQDLHRQLFDERGRRKQLEDEIEHVKRGSIAVIKYVRSHEAKEREAAVRAKEDELAEMKLRLLALQGPDGIRGSPVSDPEPPGAGASPRAAADAAEKVAREVDARLREEFSNREHEYIERETELRRRMVQLEGEVRNLRSETERGRERVEMLSGGPTALSEEVSKRLEEADSRERDLVARENALRTRFEEIRIQSDEMERRRSPLEFKERELGVYEERLATRKQALDLEARRLEEIRREVAATGSVGASDEGRRLEDLRHQLTQKEQELHARESALHERMGELEKLAGKAAEVEADQMHREAVADVQEVKVKSGVRRLDDLVYGGFPVGAQILVNGPAHTGKDVLARIFSAEGLKLGIPSIWVVTDKTWGQVREDLTGLFPGYPEAEKNGMIRYVDMYLPERRLDPVRPRGAVALLDRQGGPRPARLHRERVLGGAQGAVSGLSAHLRDGLDRHGLPRHLGHVPVPPTVRRPPEDRRSGSLLRPRDRHAHRGRPRNARAHGRRVDQPQGGATEDVPLGARGRRGPVARLDRLHLHQALAQPRFLQPRPHPLSPPDRGRGPRVRDSRERRVASGSPWTMRRIARSGPRGRAANGYVGAPASHRR